MKKLHLSIMVSALLVGSLTLTGCNNGGTSSSINTSTNTVSTTDLSSVNENLKTGVLTGKVVVTNSRDLNSVDETTITAYNLQTGDKYQTVANSDGTYKIDLPEGTYQVIAVSPKTTLKGIKVASVQRNTKTVVDIVLQAAGNIKGKVPGEFYNDYDYGMFVTIPGTSYVSSVDDNGNFELINVPAGDVIIRFGKYEARVSVEGGETVTVSDWNYTGYAPNSDMEISAVGLKYMGINKYYNGNINDLEKNIILTDENNNTVPVNIELDDYYNNDGSEYSGNIYIKTKDIVKPGVYTLSFKDNYNSYQQKIIAKNEIAVVDMSDDEGNFFVRKMGIAFSEEPSDFNSSMINIVDENGNSLQNIEIKKTSYPNVYEIDADFDPNTRYKVTFDSSIANDGIIYVSNKNTVSEDGIYIGKVDVDYVNVENQEYVYPDTRVYFDIENPEALDLKTLKVTLDGKEYNVSDFNINEYYNYYYHSDVDYANVSFKPELSYGKEYNMTITAKDIYGKEVINKTVSFKTIVPKVVGVEPYDDTGVIDADELYSDVFGMLTAYFNISDVDYKSGTIKLHDDTNDKDIETVPYIGSDDGVFVRDVNIRTNNVVNYVAKELMPNTKYTMTVTGFKTKDGYPIADKTYTFTTGDKQLLALNVANGTLEDPNYLNNQLQFFFFGKLSDEQKDELKNQITITSFDSALKTDETHPEPVVLFEDNNYGTKMVISFTIDYGRSYEVNLPSDVAKEYNVNSKLEFMTISKQVSSTTEIPWIIDNGSWMKDTFDYDLSKTDYIYDDVNIRLEIPVLVSDSYYVDVNGSSTDIYSYCNNVDKNVSEVMNWISGGDLNVTYSYASSSVSSRSYYDDNGNYIGYRYVCYVNYYIDGTMPYEENNTLVVNVPNDKIAEGVKVEDNPFTVAKIETLTPGLHYTLNVSPYAGDYDRYTGVYFEFDKPVEVSSLKNLQINITPNVDYKEGDVYITNVLNDYNFTDSVEIYLDKSSYTAYKVEINGTVKYFDIDGDIKEANISISKIISTIGDYQPLNYVNDPKISDERDILVTFNAPVEIETIYNPDTNESAFEVIESDTNKTIPIDYVDEGSCLSDECSYFLHLSEDLNESKTYILKQVGTIKKEGSVYTIEPGKEWTLSW